MKKIKKWNQVGRAVAVLLLTTAILTSCAPKKTESEEQEPLGQSAPLGGAVSESFQEDLEDSDRMSASGKHWMMWWIRTVSAI